MILEIMIVALLIIIFIVGCGVAANLSFNKAMVVLVSTIIAGAITFMIAAPYIWE